MRCKNCGWPNEDNVTRCVKCNALLQSSTFDSSRHQQSPLIPDNIEILKSTLRESSTIGEYDDYSDIESTKCPKCGYPVSATMKECPICRTPLKSRDPKSVKNNGRTPQPYINPNPSSGSQPKGTINPWATPSYDSFCTLRRIPWQNEHVSYDPVSYSGSEIILNRSNTDPNNNSITSREQAVISHNNGEWYVENRSNLQTTLIRVDRKLKLEDGDIIVLGNRMFEFRKG